MSDYPYLLPVLLGIAWMFVLNIAIDFLAFAIQRVLQTTDTKGVVVFVGRLRPWSERQEYLSQKVSRHGLGDGSKQNHTR